MAGDTFSFGAGGLELGAIFSHPAHPLLAARSSLSFPTTAKGHS